MPDGLITPELVMEVAEATRDYMITSTEFTKIMGTVASIFAGAAVVGVICMLTEAITTKFTRETGG